MISNTAGLAGVAGKRLIAHPGAIELDPHLAAPALYFLVPAGATTDWRMPQTTAFGQSMRVALPPDRKEPPPHAPAPTPTSARTTCC